MNNKIKINQYTNTPINKNLCIINTNTQITIKRVLWNLRFFDILLV